MLSPKNLHRLERLRNNEIDLSIERDDLAAEIATRVRRLAVISSLRRKTRRLIAYLESFAGSCAC